MKTTGIFSTHRYTINVPRAGVPMRLVFFGDVHRDSPLHAKDKWQEFLKYARGLKNAWFIGMGDYLDSTSTSERECLGASHYHETLKTDLAQIAAAKVSLMEKELSFMKGRLVGLLNGNHYYQFESGINSDQKLCEKLGCKFLGVSSFVRLTFVSAGKTANFDLWLHHGAGGARLPGGSINRVDQMREAADADAYAMGHDHKRSVVPANPRLHLEHSSRSGLILRQKQQWLMRTGSFLKAYEDGEVSYNADAARGPCSLGHVELEVTYQNTTSGTETLRQLTVRGIA